MESETLGQIGPKEIDFRPETNEQKTYWLGGKIQKYQTSLGTATVYLVPHQGSRELLNDRAIDSAGSMVVRVPSSLVEGKKIGDVLQIGGIIKKNGELVVDEQAEEKSKEAA